MARPSAHLVVADLTAASRQIDTVVIADREALLLQAAAAVSELRDAIASDEPVIAGPSDMIARLQSLAANVENYPAGSVAAAMMDAIDVLKALLVLRDAKNEVLLDDSEPEGRA